MRVDNREVLVVENDDALRDVLDDELTNRGFVVEKASDGRTALRMVAARRPLAMVLDLELPDVSGLDLLSQLARRQIPVVVISGRGGEIDRCVGLESGAADYLVKPFSLRELGIRIENVIGRSERRAASVLGHGTLVVDLDSRDVAVGDRSVDLTAKEFGVLALLASWPKRVFTREQILERVWGSSPEWQSSDTIYEHVHRLRKKLSPNGDTQWIETVRGLGYRFNPDGDGVASAGASR